MNELVNKSFDEKYFGEQPQKRGEKRKKEGLNNKKNAKFSIKKEYAENMTKRKRIIFYVKKRGSRRKKKVSFLVRR